MKPEPRMSPPLTVESEQRGEKTLVKVSGEVQSGNAHILDEGLEKSIGEGDRAVVDMSGVSLMTSPGLGLLIKHTERLRDPERMILAGLRPKVLDVFRALGLDHFFLITDTVEQGLELLSGIEGERKRG